MCPATHNAPDMIHAFLYMPTMVTKTLEAISDMTA